MYIIWTAMQYILHHKKIYSLFYIQIIVITLIVNLLLGLMNNVTQSINIYHQYPQFSTVYITGRNDSGSSFIEFDTSMFNQLKSKFPTVPMLVGESSTFAFLTEQASQKFTEYPFYEVKGDFSAIALSEEVALDLDQYIYAPKQFLIDLQQGLAINKSFIQFQGYHVEAVDVDAAQIILTSGKAVPVKYIEDLHVDNNIEIIFSQHIHLQNFEENRVLFKDAVIVSQSFDLYEAPTPFVSFGTHIESSQINVLTAMLDYFNELKSEYQFTFHTLRQMLQAKYNELSLLSRTVWAVLIVCTTIIVIGLIGIMSTFIERRKYHLALEKLIGATDQTIVLELFSELLLVVLSAGIIGTIAAYVITLWNPIIFEMGISLKWSDSLFILIAQILLVCSIVGLLTLRYAKQNSVRILNEG